MPPKSTTKSKGHNNKFQNELCYELTNGCVVGAYTPFDLCWRSCPRALLLLILLWSLCLQLTHSNDQILLFPEWHTLTHALQFELFEPFWYWKKSKWFLFTIINEIFHNAHAHTCTNRINLLRYTQANLIYK